TAWKCTYWGRRPTTCPRSASERSRWLRWAHAGEGRKTTPAAATWTKVPSLCCSRWPGMALANESHRRFITTGYIARSSRGNNFATHYVVCRGPSEIVQGPVSALLASICGSSLVSDNGWHFRAIHGPASFDLNGTCETATSQQPKIQHAGPNL